MEPETENHFEKTLLKKIVQGNGTLNTDSPAYCYVYGFLDDADTDTDTDEIYGWLCNILSKYDKPDIRKGILRLLALLPESGMAVRHVLSQLSSDDTSTQDCALGCFEAWNDPFHFSLLNDIHFKDVGLQNRLETLLARMSDSIEDRMKLGISKATRIISDTFSSCFNMKHALLSMPEYKYTKKHNMAAVKVVLSMESIDIPYCANGTESSFWIIFDINPDCTPSKGRIACHNLDFPSSVNVFRIEDTYSGPLNFLRFAKSMHRLSKRLVKFAKCVNVFMDSFGTIH